MPSDLVLEPLKEGFHILCEATVNSTVTYIREAFPAFKWPPQNQIWYWRNWWTDKTALIVTAEGTNAVGFYRDGDKVFVVSNAKR